tara:strand:- start:7686 stop:8849 length:1164 start_codon:yes stop_codon:yes gene_type:complete
MQDNALTPQQKAVVVQLGNLLKEKNLDSEYRVSRAIFSEFARTTANTFGIIPIPGYYNPMEMQVSKARRGALGGALITTAEQFDEQADDLKTKWGYYRDIVIELMETECDFRVSTYELRSIVRKIVRGSVDSSHCQDYNDEVKRGIKRAKYLKKVKLGDPLRDGVADDTPVYEFTDAVFDDHIPEFSNVLFTGHQLRVVKDTDDNTYLIEKLNGRWVGFGWVDNLRDSVIDLPQRLEDAEKRSVRDAIELSKQGKPIGNHLFTSSEVLALAEAQGVELPEVSTYAVCRVSADARAPYKAIPSGEVDETNSTYVAEKNLTFADAESLSNLMNKAVIHERAVTRFTNAVATAEANLKQAKEELAEAQQLESGLVRELEEFRQNLVGVAQ